MANNTTDYTLLLRSEDLYIYNRQTFSFNYGERLEYDIDVDSTGSSSINFGDIDNIRLFVIMTNQPLTVSFIQGGSQVDFEVDDVLSFTPTETFITSLSGITLQAVSETATVQIRIYGEANA